MLQKKCGIGQHRQWGSFQESGESKFGFSFPSLFLVQVHSGISRVVGGSDTPSHMTNLSEQAAATLTVPVICEGWDCIVSTLVFPPCQLSSYFLSYGSLALSACMTVCAASCKRGGLQGSRFATQCSSIKTNKAKKEQSQDPWNQRPGSGLGFVPRGWVRFAGAGGLSAERSVWAFVCSMPPYPAPLKSACFCPLHNLIEFFEPLICMHFVSKRVGEGGRKTDMPPTQNSIEEQQEGQHDWPQGEMTDTSEPKA